MAKTSGRAFANSRDVAEHFGKEHRNVMRDIDNLIRAEPSISLNFEKVSTPSDTKVGPRFIHTFDMDRDGFMPARTQRSILSFAPRRRGARGSPQF